MAEFFYAIILIGLGSLIGMSVADTIDRGDLSKCAKEHNVFQCEWVAKPVEVQK